MIGAIVILCIAAVAAQPELPPGCANPPTGVKLSDCCTNIPSFFSKKAMAENCGKTCGKGPEAVCCTTDCILKALDVVTNGKFDAVKAKASIAKLVAEKAAWTPASVGKVVDTCMASAPATLAEWKSKAPPAFVPKCTDDTSLNMVIAHCIRRELFFQCPGLSTTATCKALVDYGKGCPIFPFNDGLPGDHDHKKGDKKGDKKDDKDVEKKTKKT